ncbi:MAG: GAF domain-containing protein [Nitriliruptorales bacterium]|nr:GAF domain-containing protein [Nitriliruptorales bacterium]
MVGAERLVEVLKTLARTLVTEYSVEEMLDYLCSEMVEVLGVRGAGVMLEDRDGRMRFVAASDDVVRKIEAWQIELDEGPCLAAYEDVEPVLVPDLRTDDRFPKFSPRALAGGMVAVQSFPLVAQDQCVGALNMYSSNVAPFDDVAVEAGRVLADVTTAYILNARTLADSSKLAGQLEWALHSRVVIEQAKGKLSERLGRDVGEAFDIMRHYARSHGLRLHDVAREVVEGRLHIDAPR